MGSWKQKKQTHGCGVDLILILITWHWIYRQFGQHRALNEDGSRKCNAEHIVCVRVYVQFGKLTISHIWNRFDIFLINIRPSIRHALTANLIVCCVDRIIFYSHSVH